MALAAPFYENVTGWVTTAILVVFLVIEVIAFVNCLTQRADAFPVVGKLSKNAWVAILGGATLLTLLCTISGNIISIFALASITATAIYMLDVRPALRDATSGSGSW